MELIRFLCKHYITLQPKNLRLKLKPQIEKTSFLLLILGPNESPQVQHRYTSFTMHMQSAHTVIWSIFHQIFSCMHLLLMFNSILFINFGFLSKLELYISSLEMMMMLLWAFHFFVWFLSFWKSGALLVSLDKYPFGTDQTNLWFYYGKTIQELVWIES